MESELYVIVTSVDAENPISHLEQKIFPPQTSEYCAIHKIMDEILDELEEFRGLGEPEDDEIRNVQIEYYEDVLKGWQDYFDDDSDPPDIKSLLEKYGFEDMYEDTAVNEEKMMFLVSVHFEHPVVYYVEGKEIDKTEFKKKGYFTDSVF